MCQKKLKENSSCIPYSSAENSLRRLGHFHTIVYEYSATFV